MKNVYHIAGVKEIDIRKIFGIMYKAYMMEACGYLFLDVRNKDIVFYRRRIGEKRKIVILPDIHRIIQGIH